LLYVHLTWLYIVIVLLFAIAYEHILLFIRDGSLSFVSFSCVSTALGVLLVLRADELWIYLLLIAAALTQKQFLRVFNHHFFNPSNFAILIALWLFYDDAQLLLAQLGDELWLMFVVLGMSVAILYRASRWIIPLVFTLSYLVFEYLFVVSYDPALVFEDLLYRLYSISFLLFVLLMLTDPHTTPYRWYMQVLFALVVASATVTFDLLYGFRAWHMFLALALVSPITPLVVLYSHKEFRVKLAIITALIVACTLFIVLSIQSRAPYYLIMDV